MPQGRCAAERPEPRLVSGSGQGQFAAVAPQVGLAGREAQQVQAGGRPWDGRREGPRPGTRAFCRGQRGQLAA
ncbi:hypothetical protein GCM10017668_06440 [Streptomyces tuirus]|uniref:Uncharacterized protein n=1 Tax=Streptomyces tuirus TaxID=68278 RepID=A0A7G1N7V7_9ACTN|nr:hypothetical protein GCM10017668_06440 [Streptomyces tuirus]